MIIGRMAKLFYMYHSFISYSQGDVEAAGRLTHLLQDSGLRIWWDKDPGEHDQAFRDADDCRGMPITGDDRLIKSKLSSAIEFSILVMAVASPRTLKSTWVRIEIDMARRLRKPIFFWHVVNPEVAGKVQVRHRGKGNPNLNSFDFIEEISKYYRDEYMTTPEMSDFLNEVAGKKDLNIIGHTISPLSNIENVCDQCKALIELGELILHKGEAINADSVTNFWPEYDKLCRDALRLQITIYERFGRYITVGRKPIAEGFRLKRPFILTRIKHLKMLLEDEKFRNSEFGI